MDRKVGSIIKRFGPMLLIGCLSWAACAQSVCQGVKAGSGETTRPGANQAIAITDHRPRKSIFGIAESGERPVKGVLVEVFALLRKPKSQDQKKRIIACITDNQGRFCFRNIPPGKYEVLYSLEGGWNHLNYFVVVAPKHRKSSNHRMDVEMTLGT